MRILAIVVALAGLAGAGYGAWHLAGYGATVIEERTEVEVETALDAAGQDWVEVEADGRRVALSGTAPSEAARFRALDVAEALVSEDDLDDAITLADAEELPPEPLELAVLLTRDLVTLMGRVPDSAEEQIAALRAAPERRLVDLMTLDEDRDAPLWPDAVMLLTEALPRIETGQMQLSDGTLRVEAALPDEESRQALTALLRDGAPDGLALDLALTAPRMVLSPYPFTLSVSEGVYALDACAAPDEATARDILRTVASTTGLSGLTCPVALGVPDGNWLATVRTGIDLLSDLPAATLTIRDRVVAVEPGEALETEVAERAAERVRADLPEGYTLTVMRPATVAEAPTPTETAAPIGLTLSRGASDLSVTGAVSGMDGVEALESYAATAYPAVTTEIDLIADAPGSALPLADALVLLDALALLDTGSIRAQGDEVRITGTGAGEDLEARLLSTLDGRLMSDPEIVVEVEGYAPPVEAPAETPIEIETPSVSAAECDTAVARVQADQRIEFAPGSATLDIGSAGPLDAIASVLATCPGTQVFIDAFTDSSGGEDGNMRISQARADSVLDALLARGVFLDRMQAEGFGEVNPIATNETAEGRELNRRIEFRVVDPAGQEQDGTPETDDESVDQTEDEGEADTGTPDITTGEEAPEADTDEEASAPAE